MGDNPTDVEYLESAVSSVGEIIWEANHLADFYWTKNGKLENITGCLADTPQMDAAAEEVGAAYRKLAEALDGYRRAAKTALDRAIEATRT